MMIWRPEDDRCCSSFALLDACTYKLEVSCKSICTRCKIVCIHHSLVFIHSWNEWMVSTIQFIHPTYLLFLNESIMLDFSFFTFQFKHEIWHGFCMWWSSISSLTPLDVFWHPASLQNECMSHSIFTFWITDCSHFVWLLLQRRLVRSLWRSPSLDKRPSASTLRIQFI